LKTPRKGKQVEASALQILRLGTDHSLCHTNTRANKWSLLSRYPRKVQVAFSALEMTGIQVQCTGHSFCLADPYDRIGLNHCPIHNCRFYSEQCRLVGAYPLLYIHQF
jgi:hypothetical protein